MSSGCGSDISFQYLEESWYGEKGRKSDSRLSFLLVVPRNKSGDSGFRPCPRLSALVPLPGSLWTRPS